MCDDLEKEIEVKADEYALEESTACDYGNASKHVYRGYFYGFKEGAKFGYNKANEWHYVKDGDLPDEDVYVYLWFRGEEYPVVARRHIFKEWGRLNWSWACKWGSGYVVEADDDRIVAWKEIVLPEEAAE